MDAPDPKTRRPLSRSVLAAFTLPTLVLGIMHGPEGQIQAIYAKHAGIALTALAAVTLLTRMFDAFTYPLIGYLSDRTYARRGTRKGWLVAGALVSAFSLWKLLRPPPEVDVVYFGIWMGLTYLGWKMIEIPLQAWSFGLSNDYADRARVQGWRGMAGILGAFLFFLIPLLAMKLGYIGAGIGCAGYGLQTPGPLALPLSFLLTPLTLFMIGGSVVAAVMMADVVDYGRLLTGEDHAGIYGALLAFLSKSTTGVFAAAGLALVGFFGFDAAAATQSARAVLGIKLAVAGLPALGFFGAAAIVWNYPLDRQRIAEVQGELAERAGARNAGDS